MIQTANQWALIFCIVGRNIWKCYQVSKVTFLTSLSVQYPENHMLAYKNVTIVISQLNSI
jgi:hypothetical protein